MHYVLHVPKNIRAFTIIRVILFHLPLVTPCRTCTGGERGPALRGTRDWGPRPGNADSQPRRSARCDAILTFDLFPDLLRGVEPMLQHRKTGVSRSGPAIAAIGASVTCQRRRAGRRPLTAPHATRALKRRPSSPSSHRTGKKQARQKKRTYGRITHDSYT